MASLRHRHLPKPRFLRSAPPSSRALADPRLSLSKPNALHLPQSLEQNHLSVTTVALLPDSFLFFSNQGHEQQKGLRMHTLQITQGGSG